MIADPESSPSRRPEGIAALGKLPRQAPALAPVVALVADLERHGIEVALGGSGLLAALGLADVVHDWDLTTDAPPERVVEAVAPRAFEPKGSDDLHADQKVMFPELGAEIIVGFAFHVPDGIVRIPTRVTGRWNGLPLGSPECWAVAYALLQRDAKATLLFDWLATRGAEAAIVEELLRQPVPADVRERLAAVG